MTFSTRAARGEEREPRAVTSTRGGHFPFSRPGEGRRTPCGRPMRAWNLSRGRFAKACSAPPSFYRRNRRNRLVFLQSLGRKVLVPAATSSLGGRARISRIPPLFAEWGLRRTTERPCALDPF